VFFEPQNRVFIFSCPGVNLFFVSIGGGIKNMMAFNTVGFAFKNRWSFSSPCIFNRIGGSLVYRDDIIAIY
jgi:hypothetical protein